MWDDQTDDAGVHAVRGSAGKWLSGTDGALRWLADHGVGISGNLVGEDDYRWAYDTNMGDRKLVEHDLVSVHAEDAPLIDAARAAVKALAGVNLDDVDIPVEARAALSKLVDSVPRR